MRVRHFRLFTRRGRVLFRNAVVITTVGTAGLAAYSETFREELGGVAQGSIRSVHTAGVISYLAARYKLKLHGLSRESDEYLSTLKECHLYSARKLVDLASYHKGIYVKAGQHAASMNTALPKEFTQVLSVLQDQTDPIPFKQVQKAFRREFKAPLEDFFIEFAEKPLAAASLAQVHKATTRDGREVAVKVQYPFLDRLFGSDMRTMRLAATFVEMAFPGIDLQWLVDELEENLEQELDFRHEGGNAERVARLFANNIEVAVPRIYWDLTGKRILTMEFIHAVKITDIEGILGLQTRTQNIARILAEVFAEMIYCHGFMHSDPHPGNLLVRRHPEFGNPQLVLLDHGLYRELEESFRYHYCRLWKALMTMDEDLLKESATHLGAGEYYDLFPLLLTYRRWGTKATFGQSTTQGDKQKIRSRFKNIQFSDVLEFLETLPRDMLLVFRTTNLIRSINKDLGMPTIDRFIVFAKMSVKGTYGYRRRDEPIRTRRERLRLLWEMIKIDFRFMVTKILLYIYVWTNPKATIQMAG
eukprot:Clim_evm5s195 gene=Clim_evmTU5s195